MRRLILILLTLALAGALAACGGGDDTPSPTATPSAVPPTITPTSPPTSTPMMVPQASDDPATRAQLRVVQASPDLPPVNIYLDAGDIGRGFKPGNYHSEPLSFSPGDYLLRVVPAGEDPDQVPAYLSEQVTLRAGQSTMAVIAGPADALRLIVYQEDLAPLPNDIARVNVIQAAPGADNVLMQEANRTIVGALDFGMVGDPAEVPAGAHTFDLSSGPDTLDSVDMVLAERTAYAVVIYPDGAGAYRTLFVGHGVNSMTRLRVLHVSPDLDAVDVYLDSTPLAESLGWHESTDWTSYPSRRTLLRVVPAGQPDTEALLQKQITLNPNDTLDLILFDAAQRLRVAVIGEDLSPTPPDFARFVFVHAVPGVVQLRVGVSGDNRIPDLAPISFGTASTPLELPTGGFSFTFQDATGSGPDTVDFLPDRLWSPGSAYTIVAAGYPNADPVVLQTAVGTTDAAGEPPPGSELDRPQVNLRVIHAMTDAVAVDITIDGEPIFENVAQGVATAYYPFYQPPRHLVVQTSATGTVLLDGDLVLVLPPTTPAQVTLFIFRDGDAIRAEPANDLPILIPEGNASLRIFDAVRARPRLTLARIVPPEPFTPGPEVDLAYVTLPAPVQEQIGPSAEFGQPTDPFMMPSGTYNVLVLESVTGQLVAMIPDMPLESRTSYDLLLLPDASGQSLTPILIRHDG